MEVLASLFSVHDILVINTSAKNLYARELQLVLPALQCHLLHVDFRLLLSIPNLFDFDFLF